MVNIDTVYQKVLVLLNKEQRGYLTPQEFNLMAHRAQMEIFSSYFYDLKTAYHKPKTNTSYSDETEMLQMKMHPFRSRGTYEMQDFDDNTIVLPNMIYFLDTVTIDGTNTILTEMTHEEILYAQSNPLAQPIASRPVYEYYQNNKIIVYPTPSEITTFKFDYWRYPYTPNWAYVVVKGKALWNGSSATNRHFELHVCEEENLVNIILQLSGVVVQKPGIVEVGMAEKANVKNDQND